MANLTSVLTFAAIDDVSKPARSIAEALAMAEKAFRKTAEAMEGTGASDRFVKDLSKFKTTSVDIEQAAKALRDYAQAQSLAADRAQWTAQQAAGFGEQEKRIIALMRNVANERRIEAEQEKKIIQDRVAAEEAAAKQSEALAKQEAAARIEAAKEGLREQVEAQRQQTAAVAAHGREMVRRQREIYREMARTAASLGGMVIGGDIGHAGVNMVEHAAELEQLKFRIREDSRGNPSEAPFAEGLAREIAGKYPAISQAKALDTYLEIRANSLDANGVIDQERMRRNLGVVSQAQVAGTALGYEITPVDAQNLIKGIEGSGHAGDPDALYKMFDAYLRAKQMYGTAISSDMIRDVVANMKSANFAMGDDAFYRQLMTRITEGNASRLGNEINQTFSTFAGGAMKKATAMWLLQTGLITANQIVPTGGGNVKIKGGIKGADLLATDQSAFANTVLRPALEKLGVLSDAKINKRMDTLKAQELAAHPDAKIDPAFLRERAEAGLLSEAITQSGARNTVTDNLIKLMATLALMTRDMKGTDQTSGMDASKRIGENPVAAFSEMTNAISNFGSVLTSPIMANAAGVLNGVANSIAGFSQSVADIQKAHPELAKWVAGLTPLALTAGGGVLAWGGLDTLMSGFGLKGSAAALDVAAADLSAAAVKLGIGSGVPGGLPETPGAKPGEPGAVPDTPSAKPSATPKAPAPAEPWFKFPKLATIAEGVKGGAVNYLAYKAGEMALDYIMNWTPEKQAQVDKAEATAWNDVYKLLMTPWPEGGSWPATKDVRLNQAYARQADMHPILHGERDMEGARAGALTRISEAAAQQENRDAGNLGRGLPADSFGPVKLRVDAADLDHVTTKADEAKLSFSALAEIVALNVDTSAIDAAIAKVDQLRSALSGLSGGLASVSSLGRLTRGGFTTQGVQGQ